MGNHQMKGAFPMSINPEEADAVLREIEAALNQSLAALCGISDAESAAQAIQSGDDQLNRARDLLEKLLQQIDPEE